MIAPLFQEATQTTPLFNFDSENGVLEIKGKMTPENSTQLFEPIINWVDKYIDCPSAKTLINVHLEYFNTSSSKYIMTVFKMLEKLRQKNHQAKINWICDKNDEDMIEAGEDFQALVDLPIDIIEMDE